MTVFLRLRFVGLQCRGTVCKLLWDTLYQGRDSGGERLRLW